MKILRAESYYTMHKCLRRMWEERLVAPTELSAGVAKEFGREVFIIDCGYVLACG